MTDAQLADELVRQATLIRLGQKTFTPRAKMLLTATFFDNDCCDEQGRVDDDKITKQNQRHIPSAMFVEIAPSDRTLQTMQYRSNFSSGHWDPEIDLTLRVFHRNFPLHHLVPGPFNPSFNPAKAVFTKWY